MRLFDMDSREDYLLDGKYKVATPYAPLVDVVEVVRCKDCHLAEDDIMHMYCVYFGHKVCGEDYCSNAVGRKEDSEVEE